MAKDTRVHNQQYNLSATMQLTEDGSPTGDTSLLISQGKAKQNKHEGPGRNPKIRDLGVQIKRKHVQTINKTGSPTKSVWWHWNQAQLRPHPACSSRPRDPRLKWMGAETQRLTLVFWGFKHGSISEKKNELRILSVQPMVCEAPWKNKKCFDENVRTHLVSKFWASFEFQTVVVGTCSTSLTPCSEHQFHRARMKLDFPPTNCSIVETMNWKVQLGHNVGGTSASMRAPLLLTIGPNITRRLALMCPKTFRPQQLHHKQKLNKRKFVSKHRAKKKTTIVSLFCL